ncbi:MAG: hypothetical protein LLG20_25895 [Acidobacteriales bacterium]|nr:hypothetical protein [Terriglobales bacterium]
MRRTVLVLAAIWGIPASLPAQDNAELLNRLKSMEERIRALEAEVQTLKGQKAVAPAPAPEIAPTPPPEVAPVQAPASASKVFNPDMAVIGDFLGAAGQSAGRGTPSLEMHESEASFQAVVDPYARADFFLSFGEQGVNLEEGYLTFTALPAGLQLRTGKMRAAFGRVNTMHNHVLSWVDRPLVTGNLLGGEDGINDAGLSLSRILPAPKNIFLEATGQVFRGDSEGVFRSWRRSDVSTVGHLRGYGDINESTNLDLGFSYARGHSPQAASLINQFFGLDATLRWKPLRRSIYHSFTTRSEFVWGRAQQPSRVTTPFGYYISTDYQFARRWFVGGRFDRSGRLTDSSLLDTGGSLILTFWPSEFSQIRGQLRRTHYGEGQIADELLFQFQFSIGAHGAHPF